MKEVLNSCIEVLYDSYRVQLMNPYTILLELLEIIEGWKKNKIKDFKTVQAGLKESLQLMKKDSKYNLLVFEPFDNEYFCTLLENASKNTKESTKTHLTPIKNYISLILSNNRNYLSKLVTKLKDYLVSNDQIDSTKVAPEYYDPINTLTGFLLSGLIHRGYDKDFLFRYFYKIFIYTDSQYRFSQAFDQISTLVSQTPKAYTVWFKVNSRGMENIHLFGNCIVEATISYEPTPNLPKKMRDELSTFKRSSNGTYKFINVQVEALDYFAALQKAKYTIAENLDILNLGFGSTKLTLSGRALVQDSINPDKANFQSTNHQLDGYYKTGNIRFNAILHKVPNILQSNAIADDSKEKIKSAIRYLRMGNEAIEIEHNFVNYWVGLEYLFSNYTDSSFTRIKNHLSTTQTIIYAKRNLSTYLNNCKTILANVEGTHFDMDDINCLKDAQTYDEVVRLSSTRSPLLHYRSWFYKSTLLNNKNKERRKEYLNNHKTKLEQHLIRLYRVRNEIIHEAKFNFVSKSLTSNLKYYLITTLSLIINNFEEHIKQNQHSSNPSIKSINDFFVTQELKFNYWVTKKFELDLILDTRENFELLG